MDSDTERIRRLQASLDAAATEKSRTFWTRYLKGDAMFRGTSMGDVRKAVHVWWDEQAIWGRGLEERKRLALRLFEEPYTEDKLAGVLALSELLLDELSAEDLPSFADLFQRSHIDDWNVCDWFCVKVLGKMVERDAGVAPAISDWRLAEPLWQRRAACVAFVNHAKFGDDKIPGLTDLIIRNANSLVHDPERFAQTGVGWVLRELSIARPDIVIAFAEEHATRLSREAMKSLAAKLPADERTRVLALPRV